MSAGVIVIFGREREMGTSRIAMYLYTSSQPAEEPCRSSLSLRRALIGSRVILHDGELRANPGSHSIRLF